MAKALCRWAVSKGYLSLNPFADIRPVGRPNRGKKQLRFDEAERFITTAFQLFDERQDTMALAAVTALLLGCRASEVLQLRVRDLDCGGIKLWIAARDGAYRGQDHQRGARSRRAKVLRPRLLKLSTGQPPDAYLFGLSSTGKPKNRQLLHSTVQRLCVAAGVPVVCPHSLRGVWATAGVSSGALSHTVAAALGHGSFAVTAKHYVQAGALEGARTQRLVQMMDLDPAKSASPPASCVATMSRRWARHSAGCGPLEIGSRDRRVARAKPSGRDGARRGSAANPYSSGPREAAHRTAALRSRSSGARTAGPQWQASSDLSRRTFRRSRA